MNKQKLFLVFATIALIGTTAGLLTHLHQHQKLGLPGVRTAPLQGSENLEVLLPQLVLDYTSVELPLQEIVTNTLPKDTSFGQRRFSANDGFYCDLQVVLMGNDRTSLHKPQFCLTGSGWHIDRTEVTTVPMQRPFEYSLPVVKLCASRDDGPQGKVSSVFVYNYVADKHLSASTTGIDRMWLMARDLMFKGVLQRWAYIIYFSPCPPGQEDATFERMKKFIAASAPEFQLTPSSEGTKTAQK